jgi:hypothetical protein
MGRVFRRFFVDLFQGDSVALIVAGVIGGIALIICLIWWKIARDLRHEDEKRKGPYVSKKKKP